MVLTDHHYLWPARYLDRFRDIGHPFSTRAKGLHDLLLYREGRLLRGGEDALVQGHGDYHPKNIIIGHAQLTSASRPT